VATIARWITDGARLRDGTRLPLRATRLPGRWVVEPGAVEEFLAALTADRSGTCTSAGRSPQPAPARTPSARRKDVERADRELTKKGL
jgi:hypothetical protein